MGSSSALETRRGAISLRVKILLPGLEMDLLTVCWHHWSAPLPEFVLTSGTEDHTDHDNRSCFVLKFQTFVVASAKRLSGSCQAPLSLFTSNSGR